MFSEYASKYLSKSQRPAPLFNGAAAGDSDVDDYLEAVSGSTDDGSLGSESDSDSVHSESELDESRRHNSNSGNPPSELLVERPSQARGASSSRHKPKHKQGISLWKQNVNAWTRRPAPIGSPMPDPRAPSSGPSITQPEAQPRYDPESGIRRSKPIDNLVAAIYLVSLAFTLATASLVSVSAPANGGNIYPIFVYSARSLVLYALLAAAVSAAWLYCLRYFTRAVVQMSVFGVPAVLVATSVGSVVMSVHSNTIGWHGLAHGAMRLSALVPFAVALLWVLYLRRVKDVTGKAAEIIVLSANVYNECTPAMTVLTFVSGVASLAITGLWSVFLARAFMEGKVGVLLVLWFSFMYLWTWELVCGLLRAIITNVTAAWYANAPAGTDSALNAENRVDRMEGVLSLSFYEAVTFHFGSVCLSALVAVLAQIPLLVLPSSWGRAIQRVAEVTIASSASRILNPLALPIAVIQRLSITSAAQMLGSPAFANVDKRAYRLAKLFLVAGRLCCSLAVGFVAWIHADRVRDVSSAYGYLVAIVAWFIGWTVMGASENIVSMICDALLVSFVLNSGSPRHQNTAKLFTAGLEEESYPQSEYSD